MSLSSILGRRAGKSTVTHDDMVAMARAAWHGGSDWVCIHLPSITNEWDRQHVENVAEKQHGKREKR